MVGVCIKYFHENYGGMLQAYATIKVLEERGIEYELIQYKKKISLGYMIKSIPRVFNSTLIHDKQEGIQKKISLKKHPELYENEQKRMTAFKKFRDMHFKKLSRIYYGYNELSAGAKKYDAVITGSDQLWSPAGLPTNYYNLMFVPDNICKISYASSFGVKNIPWYQRKRTRKFLNRLDYISMREIRGSEIVKELTGNDVPTILDPVFMFDAKKWEQLIPVVKEIKEPYIFAYFLGKNQEYRVAVSKLAQRMKMKIVTLRHLDQYVDGDETFGDFAPYDVDPGRFLNLLRGASYVCTDSFHGSVFSIIHRKKFIIFNRYSDNSKTSKNSRIDSLCENMGVSRRRYTSQDSIYQRIIEPIDYDKVECRFQRIKLATDEFLDQAFGAINQGGTND